MSQLRNGLTSVAIAYLLFSIGILITSSDHNTLKGHPFQNFYSNNGNASNSINLHSYIFSKNVSSDPIGINETPFLLFELTNSDQIFNGVKDLFTSPKSTINNIKSDNYRLCESSRIDVDPIQFSIFFHTEHILTAAT